VIDFDTLVLGPSMAVFGQPCTVTPGVSQPGVAPYAAPGIFKANETSIPMDDGSVIASTICTLGIRLSDYAIPMVPDDQVTVAGMTFWVDRVHPDGQGGATLTLRRSPP
jgi:hypothetical protein